MNTRNCQRGVRTGRLIQQEGASARAADHEAVRAEGNPRVDCELHSRAGLIEQCVVHDDHVRAASVQRTARASNKSSFRASQEATADLVNVMRTLLRAGFCGSTIFRLKMPAVISPPAVVSSGAVPTPPE